MSTRRTQEFPMGWTSWLRRVVRRQPVRRRGMSDWTPRVVVLEDRTLPSTFTVLNTRSGGFGSLRQMVLLANLSPGTDTIRFAPAVSGVITLANSLLVV